MTIQRRTGFTLIEMLVVIAIVALLVSLLLPALKRGRNAAMVVKSLSNLRQINIASATYREEQKGFMPLALNVPRGNFPNKPWFANHSQVQGWCTWAFGGKNPDAYWYTRSGGAFDVEAADRLLNPYVYPEITFNAPPMPTRMPPTDPNRKTAQAEVFRDPSDKVSYQHSANFHTNPTPIQLSSYDDVGTSYHFNVKWWDQIPHSGTDSAGIPRFNKAFTFGCNRLRVSDAFAPARMVWVHDQYADVVANNNSAQFKLRNGFNDINKSVMAFMDGHASYHPVFPGDLPTSYSNQFYTFVFEDLRIPAGW